MVMIAEIEIVMLRTEPCRACGRRHRYRAALRTAEQPPTDSLLGFFARCPRTGRRQWYVLPVPGGVDGRSRLLALGPGDDEQWEPDDRCFTGRRYDALHRGNQHGGFRDRGSPPALLRQALGCPIS
jgi:hypothetical protein